MMNEDFSCLKFLNIFKECRNIMVGDTLNNNSPDLYDALYSDVNSEIYKIKLELYETKWIEMHWDKANDFINKSDYSIIEKKELVSMFAEKYENFINNWNYTEFDKIIFEKRIDILRTLILTDNEWEQKLKRIKVSFEQRKKILEKEIKELEMEG